MSHKFDDFKWARSIVFNDLEAISGDDDRSRSEFIDRHPIRVQMLKRVEALITLLETAADGRDPRDVQMSIHDVLHALDYRASLDAYREDEDEL